jgi:hypothetical protein
LSTEWAAHETWYVVSQPPWNPSERSSTAKTREKRCHSSIVIALNSPEHARDVYWDLIFERIVPSIPGATYEEFIQRYETKVVPRIRAFMEASRVRQDFLEKKVREQLEFFEVEKEYYNFEIPRRIVKRY